MPITDIQDFPWYSVTVLAASATWTGEWKRILYLPLSTDTEIPVHMPWARYVSGVAFADQSGTLRVQQSNDGSTVHFQEDFAVTAGATGSAAFLRRIYSPWVRLLYINGAVAQTSFSIFGLAIGSV
jgi:hypothetical protein